MTCHGVATGSFFGGTGAGRFSPQLGVFRGAEKSSSNYELSVLPENSCVAGSTDSRFLECCSQPVNSRKYFSPILENIFLPHSKIFSSHTRKYLSPTLENIFLPYSKIFFSHTRKYFSPTLESIFPHTREFFSHTREYFLPYSKIFFSNFNIFDIFRKKHYVGTPNDANNRKCNICYMCHFLKLILG